MLLRINPLTKTINPPEIIYRTIAYGPNKHPFAALIFSKWIKGRKLPLAANIPNLKHFIRIYNAAFIGLEFKIAIQNTFSCILKKAKLFRKLK